MRMCLNNFYSFNALIISLLTDTTLFMQAPANGATPGASHLEVTSRHQFRLTYEVDARWPAGETAQAFFHLPIPPETGGQHIEKFESSLQGNAAEDEATPPRRFQEGSFHHDPADSERLRWLVQITGVFSRHELSPGPSPTSSSIQPPQEGEFLAATPTLNWKEADFQDWLDASGLRISQDETALHFGTRLFQRLTSRGRYVYPPLGGWKASTTCQRIRCDCGGFSILFAAACRANHIPARMLVGQWFKTREEESGTVEMTGRQAHVIAEFFDPQIGWVPEDIASTLMKVPGATGDGYFGREPGFFFTWHFDSDIDVDVPHAPRAHLQWIQNPSLWFSQNAEDAAESISHRWTLETLR